MYYLAYLASRWSRSFYRIPGIPIPDGSKAGISGTLRIAAVKSFFPARLTRPEQGDCIFNRMLLEFVFGKLRLHLEPLHFSYCIFAGKGVMMIEKPYQLQSDTLAIRTGRNGTLLAITIRSGATVIALDDAVGLKRLVDVEWNGEKMLMFADDLRGNRMSDPSVGRREPEQVLIEHSLDLARSNEELERFAFTVAHDLQEPLRSIEAMTQLFLERNKSKLDTDSAHLLDFVVSSAERMKRLIHDLLEFAVVSHRFEASEVDSQAVVEIAVQQLHEAIEQSGATVAIESLPLIGANGDLLLRLFQNLIMNAIKYAGEGPPVIHISASASDGETVFAVKDNGIGIDQKYHQQIFDPFRRLHTASEHEGTGIGLATCKRIVAQHGGRIWVESQPGEGSKFLFAIPKVTMGSSEKNATRKPNQDSDPNRHEGRAAAG